MIQDTYIRHMAEEKIIKHAGDAARALLKRNTSWKEKIREFFFEIFIIVIAVSTNAAARAASNPAQATSQCSVAWCGFNDDVSQSVHGSRPTPIAPKTTITYCRSVQWPGRMGCLHCRK